MGLKLVLYQLVGTIKIFLNQRTKSFETYSYNSNLKIEISQTLLLLNSLFEFRISNVLYGNNLCSSYELAKGFRGPVENWKTPKTIPQDILKARDTLLSKRKLNLILRSKSIEDPLVKIDDLVQAFIKLQNEKRSSRAKAKPVLPYDKSSGIVAVPRKNSKKINASVEDVRFAIIEDKLMLNTKMLLMYWIIHLAILLMILLMMKM